jgi:Ni,Fe-hydrogenase III large subunit/Ni,Fe-hydrogenase III component G
MHTDSPADIFSTRYDAHFTSLSTTPAACIATVDALQWSAIAQKLKAEGGRFISLWGSDRQASGEHFSLSAAYCAAEGLFWLRLEVREEEGYPDLSTIFPAALRMQRSLFDLLGICANGALDTRPWLNHGEWPDDYFPLRHDNNLPESGSSVRCEYPFVSVEGDGVHEMAVGPVHAGIIEPGHFHFSIVGEKVLRLEQRFGYVHRGIDQLMIGKSLAEGVRIAGRVSGDSTVAFAWAYSMAAENACAVEIPQRAQWLRVLLLERERIANHLTDLGAMANDAGFAFGPAQFSRLKEDWVRLNHHLFGHRFLMDRIIPGGVTVDLDSVGLKVLFRQCDEIEKEVRALRLIYDGHAGLQDRFIGAGRVSPKLAAQLGLCGLLGRASGQAWDARIDQASGPYALLKVKMANHLNGDVAARMTVRFDEVFESLRLLREVMRQLPAGPVAVQLPATNVINTGNTASAGIGWLEGWRGAIFVALEKAPDGSILRCHFHDPSWQNWPVLQHAIMGNILPDFPLINKSFNLSYAGHDL